MVNINDSINTNLEYGISHHTGKIIPRYFGVDMGSKDDVTIISFYPKHFLKLRDRITIHGYSHKFIHYAKHILDEINIIPGQYIKPSRGYAKHIRRMKQCT